MQTTARLADQNERSSSLHRHRLEEDEYVKLRARAKIEEVVAEELARRVARGDFRAGLVGLQLHLLKLCRRIHEVSTLFLSS